MMLAGWRLRDVDPGAAAHAEATRGGGDGWIDVDAPGDTYLALVGAGRLAHPYRGRGEAGAHWVRDREWWWHTRFAAPAAASGETVELVFEGLDTFADVYLDGEKIGAADNMFRSWRFDVTGRVGGDHHLAVCFHPTAAKLAGKPLPTWKVVSDRISKSRRTLVRKAQFGWGWDWGPDLPTVGVWRPARLERRKGAAIAGVNFTTLSIGETAADIRVDIELVGDAEVKIDILDPDGVVVAHASRHGAGAIALTIQRPLLWWSADLGAQPLYTLVASLPNGARLERKVGIRTIAIDQSPDPDEPGATFFRFILNGVAIFARGACWAPASSFVAAIDDSVYRDLLSRAVDANMNMVRIWGGGIYEPDVFYEECDRLGLLVWQDFMFACAPYPDDDAFTENVRREVIDQVRRLRGHPCLVLWCGNNENQAIQHLNNARTGHNEPLAGQAIYDELIPGVLRGLDPDTPYWPSSPWGGPSPNSMRGGDVHNWTVWHGIPLVFDADPVGNYETAPEGVAFTRYAEDLCRFVSEFGIQAAPDMATLERWMARQDLELNSQGFLDRIKDVADKAAAMMLPVTGRAENLADYVDFTMLTQAEGMKFGIEHFRRRKPHCSGALIWQYNDCWPCVSWSLIDYDGVAKSSYYATKRGFAPMLASFRRVEGDQVELWLSNDTLAPLHDTLAITLERLHGGVAWREEIAIAVAANSSIAVWKGSAPQSSAHILHVRSRERRFPGNRLTLAPITDLQLVSDPGVSATQHATAGGLLLEIVAKFYALAIRLRVGDPAARFSDNYFDLAAGERKSVLVTHAMRAPLGGIEVSCWNDRHRVIEGF
jgi:beta-mannosidase